jgi:hypothetical protein
MTKAARDYLTALETKRLELEKNRGSATAEAFVKGQKEQGKKLANKERGGMQTAAQGRIRSQVASARKPLTAKTEGPKSNFDPKKNYAKKDNLTNFIKDTFNGKGPFKPVSEDKKQAFYDKAKSNLDKRNSGK